MGNTGWGYKITNFCALKLPIKMEDVLVVSCGPWIRRNQLYAALQESKVEGVREVYKKTGSQENSGYIRFTSLSHLEAALASHFPLAREGGKHFTAKRCLRDESFWEKYGEGKPMERVKNRGEQQAVDPKLIHEVVTPLGGMPYSDQLVLKQGDLCGVLRDIAEGLVGVLVAEGVLKVEGKERYGICSWWWRWWWWWWKGREAPSLIPCCPAF